jgi:5-bromo-4-chloroindolyl phosphate hydrolysis protein
MNRFSTISGVISGVVGGFVLLFFFFLLHETLLISGAFGLAGLIGAYVLTHAFKPKKELSFNLRNPVTTEDLNRTLRDGDEKIQLLQSYSTKLTDPKVREKLTDITEIVRDIYGNFKRDPKNIKYARQFLSYYLDTTIKIVKKYSDLAAQDIDTPEIRETLTRAENMLATIERAFEKQKAKLLTDDVMDLDVEIEMLEKTFAAEDLK